MFVTTLSILKLVCLVCCRSKPFDSGLLAPCQTLKAARSHSQGSGAAWRWSDPNYHPLYMGTCRHIFTHINMYEMYICIQISIHVYVCVYVHVHVYVCVYVCIGMCMCMCIYIYMYRYRYVYVYMYMYMYMYVYMYMYMYVYLFVYVYVCFFICICVCRSWWYAVYMYDICNTYYMLRYVSMY